MRLEKALRELKGLIALIDHALDTNDIPGCDDDFQFEEQKEQLSKLGDAIESIVERFTGTLSKEVAT